MMFPGHPYLRQETRRAENDGERKERERVLRLLALARSRMKLWRDYPTVEQEANEELLGELERAVQQGWQRL